MALLDAQSGVQFEGETAPDPDPAHFIAVRAWRLLSNGMGGIDWAGLPVVTEMLGIEDVQELIGRLLVIRSYKPEDSQDGPRNPVD